MKDNILIIPTPATISIYDDTTILVERICQVTKREYSFTVPLEKYMVWRGGESLQDAFPDLNLDYREILISGWTPDEWNLLFNENEDDDVQ